MTQQTGTARERNVADGSSEAVDLAWGRWSSIRAVMVGGWPLALVLLAGTLLRAIPVVTSDFPLNDGGLFLSMTDDIRRNGYLLPEVASYNGVGIPFAYPPLALYLAALATDAGVDTLQVLRWLPLVASLAAMPVAYALFLRLMGKPAWALIATGAFAAMPHAYEWLIGGGGLTRSVGFTLGLGCILAFVVAVQSRQIWPTIVMGILGGLTTLAHPQAAVFAGLSVVVLAVGLQHPLRRTTSVLATSAAVGAALVGPWLLAVLSAHGPDPLLSAAMTGGSPLDGLRRLLSLDLSGGGVEVLGAIAAFGVFVGLVNRQWWIPAWILAVFVVGSRKSLIFASVPVSIAAAYGLVDLLRLMRLTEPRGLVTLGRSRAGAAVGAMFILAVASAGAANLDPSSPTHSLNHADREAMAWVARETPSGSRFLVVSGTAWNLDASAEWFPVLAERSSDITVQGWEWLGRDAFAGQRGRHDWMQSCAVRGERLCVDQWLREVGDVDYVYLVDSATARSFGYQCCLAMAEQIEHQLRGEEVFRSDRVIIMELLPARG